MKLRLKGYILKRCDTNEYLKELVVDGDFGIASWVDLESSAGLFNSKYDAIIVGNDIATAIKIPMQLQQLFTYQQISKSVKGDPKRLNETFAAVSF